MIEKNGERVQLHAKTRNPNHSLTMQGKIKCTPKIHHLDQGKNYIFNREHMQARSRKTIRHEAGTTPIEVFWPTIRRTLDSCLRKNDGRKSFCGTLHQIYD
jgi:hypothetical protein